MPSFLEILVREAEERVASNYYKCVKNVSFNSISLKNAILKSKNTPIIAEIKKRSPSIGDLVNKLDVKKVALEMEMGGAIGISILTEPKRFKGSLNDLIEVRKQVKLETHTEEEFDSAIKTKADLIGINNRNLETLDVNINVSKRILSRKIDFNNKVIVSESGIKSLEDIRELRKLGVHAFLIGTSIITSKNIKEKVREYANA
jgi:indole-3-glycerol phosphate synthase